MHEQTEFCVGDEISAFRAKEISDDKTNKRYREIKKIAFSKIYQEALKGESRCTLDTLNDFGKEGLVDFAIKLKGELESLGYTVEIKELSYKIDYLVLSW